MSAFASARPGGDGSSILNDDDGKPQISSSFSVGRAGLVIALVAGFIIVYSVLVSPAIRGDNNNEERKKSHAAARPPTRSGNNDKDTRSLQQKQNDELLARKKKQQQQQQARRRHIEDEKDDDEDVRDAPTPAPKNRVGDGVPGGRGAHFDAMHVQKVKEMVEYARANHLPDPFPGVAPEDLEDHINDHKNEKISGDRAPQHERRPINRVNLNRGGGDDDDDNNNNNVRNVDAGRPVWDEQKHKEGPPPPPMVHFEEH